MVEVHADDTDIALMLVHHWKVGLHDIIFCATQSRKCWSISESSLSMSPKIKDTILFIHAVSGCDTTSALYGIGKPSILKKFEGIIYYMKIHLQLFNFNTLIQGCQRMIEFAKVLMCHNTKDDTIHKMSEKLFVRLYGGKERETLGALR